MSIQRCKHCDNQYDQDTHVEHEEVCGENRIGMCECGGQAMIEIESEFCKDCI